MITIQKIYCLCKMRGSRHLLGVVVLAFLKELFGVESEVCSGLLDVILSYY